MKQVGIGGERVAWSRGLLSVVSDVCGQTIVSF